MLNSNLPRCFGNDAHLVRQTRGRRHEQRRRLLQLQGAKHRLRLYQDGAGPFDTAIRFAVGMDPIQGGDDDKVIKACDACYEDLKQRPNRREGKVLVFKIRHPDGKQKVLKEYEF